MELTFLVGENRTRTTTRRLSHPSLFNDLIKFVKVFREFARRSRQLDLAVFKAQEYRNIVLFMFPIVIQCIETGAKERRVWLLLAFMFRSCVLPELEFEAIDKNDIRQASDQFYSLYEKLFSSKNCTYSIHIVGSHMLDIREKGPLTATSAFAFENFYGEMRKCFAPGSVSPLKQIMQRTYLKRSLSYHVCEKKIFYSEKDTALECNSLIYIYENATYNMYKIIKTEKNNPMLQCFVQGRIEMEFDEADEYDWSKIGVFKEGATGNDIIEINSKNVHGKVLKISSLLITCPLNVLREQ